MSKQRDHLNDCLERLFQGEELESCLKDYPKEAEELRLLLTTFGRVKRYAETIKLRPEFITQTQANLVNTYESQYLSWKVRIAGMLKPVGRFAAVAAIAIVLLVGTFASGVTLSVLASEDIMPGQTLYPIKLATEQIRTTFAFSDERKVNYLTQFAEARAKEMVYEAEKGDSNQVEAALERLERNLANVQEIVAPSKAPSAIAASEQEPTVLQKIETTVKASSTRARDTIRELKEPDPEKKEKIVDRVSEAYSKAIKAIEAVKADKVNK